MKIFLVGGAVRDKLLGLPVKERDWVVVGATEKEMIKLGFRQVGKDFPVFLHPRTGEEYALARMECKIGAGYKGFTFDTSPHVALEQDLIRRDLTINAMAETASGELIDPFHGRKDLENKLLKHVSPAFAEDPVRVLRVARFLARYAHLGFKIAPETMELMRAMVNDGEVNALVAERVWKELERALSEKNPEAFFLALQECGALAILFPHFSGFVAGIESLNRAVTLSDLPRIRFAALVHQYAEKDTKEAVASLCQRYRIPNLYCQLATLTAQYYRKALQAKQLTADELVQLFNAFDIWRREQRFHDFLLTVKSIDASFDAGWLANCAKEAKSIDVQELIAQGFSNQALQKKLKEERIARVDSWLNKAP